MLVKDYMMKHPPMTGPKTSIIEAQHLMTENNVHYLPVVKDGKRLIGLVTRQTMLLNPGRLSSLDVWDITHYLANMTVKDVMLKASDVQTVDSGATIEQAAQLMVECDIGCLPVINDGIVVGLITNDDLLKQLTNMMTGHLPGVRVTVRMPMRKGELAKLVAAIAEKGMGILTMGGATSPKDESKWDAVVKIRGKREAVLAALSDIKDHEILDVREV